MNDERDTLLIDVLALGGMAAVLVYNVVRRVVFGR